MMKLFSQTLTSFNARDRIFGGIQLFLFHSSSILNQKDSETVYNIAGSILSVADIREMKAESRTVAHWRVLVDWDLQAQRPYVIVDPYDPRGLLYLSRGEYLLQSRVSLTNDLTLIVVARPGDKAPTPSSQNSPTHDIKFGEGPFSSTKFFRNRANRLAWKDFVRLRNFSSNNVRVKDGMVSVSPKTIERAVIVWIRQLLHYSSVTAPERRLLGFVFLAGSLRAILSNNGVEFLAKRLKIALFCVYSYLSGNPLESTDPLGLRIRLSHGLPTIIPRDYRNLIRSGNLLWIRIWVSILNIYRSLKVKTPDPESAYKTIRKPLPVMVNFHKFQYFAKHVFPILLKQKAIASDLELPSYSYSLALGEIIRSAGANLKSSISLFSIILDAKAWMSRAENHILKWFMMHGDETAIALISTISTESHFPNDSTLYDELVNLDSSSSRIPSDANEQTKAEIEQQKTEKRNLLIRLLATEGSLSAFLPNAWKLANEVENRARPILGRLFNFDAPGGKLRTVAICDYWTQIAMKPIHDYLFSVLKILVGNDATFDQQGVVDQYWSKGYKPHWSFDLSAATDSIPIPLYIEVLASVLRMKGEDYQDAYSRAELWAKIMTDRDFGIPSPKKHEIGYNGGPQCRTIRYGTGQPMGAYSSWAAMALVHHALVQYANWLKNENTISWFDPYLVLGDDVDISKDATVAANYQLVCANFEVKIGLHKSLKSSSNFFEFANQRLCDGGNISPLSFLEEITSKTWRARVEFASRIAARFAIKVTPQSLIRMVTSARQWQHLIPEFQGIRDKVYIRFLYFILLSPLKADWHSSEPISIATINNWLQHLNKALLEPINVAVSDPERLNTILCKRICAKIRALIDETSKKLLARPISPNPSCGATLLPPPIGLMPFAPSIHVLGIYPSMIGHFTNAGQLSEIFSGISADENFLTLVQERGYTREHVHALRELFNAFVTDSIRVPKLAPVAYTYLFYCAFKHNENVRKRFAEMETEFHNLERKVKARDVPAQLFKMLVREESPLSSLILLYFKIAALPQVIDLKDGITSAAFGVKPAVQPKDTASVLLKEIIPEVAKWTGVAVTNLPIMSEGVKNFKSADLRSLQTFFKKAVEEAGKVKYGVYR